MGMLLQDIHARDEWSGRNTFSGLLELTERAEKLGMSIANPTYQTVSCPSI